MEKVFELGINFVESALIINFLGEYNGYKHEGKKKWFSFWIAVAISFTETTFFNYISYFSELSLVLNAIICLCYCYFALNSSLGNKFVSCIFAMSGLIFTSTFMVFLFSMITKSSVIELLSVTNFIRITFVIATKILLFLYLKCIVIFCKNIKNHYVSGKMQISMLLVPFVTFVVMALVMNLSLNDPITTKGKVYAILATIGLFAIDILVFVLFSELCNAYEAKLKAEIMNMKYKNLEDMMNVYEKIRTIRHNIKNSAASISDLIRTENYDKALYLVQSLYADADKVRNFIVTGNDTLTSLLNTKIGEANDNDIRIVPIVDANSLRDMDDYDMVTLMGNLLDNAIDACKKNKGDRNIEVFIQDGDDMQIIIKNTVDMPVLESNPNLLTTKEDKLYHGLGIKSVKKVVGKYDGIIDIYDENNKFCVNILLYKTKKS